MNIEKERKEMNSLNIKGEKVLLRAIEVSDSDILRQMINDEKIEAMMWGYSFPVSQNQQIKWIDNLSLDNTILRVMIEVEGKAIGTAMLTDIDMKNGIAEIHIKIAEYECRGKGYGTDTIKTITKYAFEQLRLNCVYCRVHESNHASQKMFLKCGYKFEGVLRSRVFRNGKYHNYNEYSILRDEMV